MNAFVLEKKGKNHFWVYVRRGNQIAKSRVFKNLDNARQSIATIRKNLETPSQNRMEINIVSSRGRGFKWLIKGGNGRGMAQSMKVHKTRNAAKKEMQGFIKICSKLDIFKES